MAKKATVDNEDKIADIPRLRDLSNTANAVSFLAIAGKVLSPLLRLAGHDIRPQLKELAEARRTLVPQIKSLVEAPDEFNRLLGNRGWIAYSMMSHERSLGAIDLARAGRHNEADALLADSYDDDALQFNLLRMRRLRFFADRMELAQLAAVDHSAQRYHAVVPVLLAMIDGLSSDVSRQNESIFSQRADPTSWNSVVGHPRGLKRLANLMQEPRMKTRTEPITIPYRHGILHGRDLGYANKIVAAKCWSMLFATGEWAADVEEGRRTAPPPVAPPTLRELAKDLTRTVEKHQRWKQRLEALAPRDVTVGTTVPAEGLAAAYDSGSPERTLVEFIHYWAKPNYGGMSKLVDAANIHPGVRPKRIRKAFEPWKIRGDFRLVSIASRGPSVVDIELVLDGTAVEVLLWFVDDEGNTQLPDGLDGGSWRIVNWANLAASMSRAAQDASMGVEDTRAE